MKRVLLGLALLASACSDDSAPASPTSTTPVLGFFVTSQTSTTGNLGGLRGADATCQRLATAVGAGNRTWRAYLSAARDNTNNNLPAHARDRIGPGPWYNANGALGPAISTSCMRAPATLRYSWTSAGSASTVSGPDRRRQSSTTS